MKKTKKVPPTKKNRATRAEKHLMEENHELRTRLAEAETAFSAIRNGEVDCIVISGEGGERLYSLTSAETPYRIIIEEMNEGAVTLSADGLILYSNRRFAEIISRPPEKITGTYFQGLVGEKDQRLFDGLLASARKRHTQGEINYFGGIHPLCLQVSLSPLPHEIVGDVCMVIRDMTELKTKERELAKYRDTLEERVRERTAELMVANRELAAFSYSVSHDLRAPLRAVGGYTRMLEADYFDSLDENGRRLLGVISKSAERMGLLIDELLALSRLGKKEVRKTFVDMTALANTCHAELEAGTPHHARLVIHPLHPALADPVLISQVWTNLLSNAVKYSSKVREPLIEIGSVEKDGQVIYHVRDNGAGFEMEYASKLFGIFQRLHSNEEFEGTGVGLAITHRIIEKHNGKIWAEGKVNGGATFWFSLPARNDELSGAPRMNGSIVHHE